MTETQELAVQKEITALIKITAETVIDILHTHYSEAGEDESISVTAKNVLRSEQFYSRLKIQLDQYT